MLGRTAQEQPEPQPASAQLAAISTAHCADGRRVPQYAVETCLIGWLLPRAWRHGWIPEFWPGPCSVWVSCASTQAPTAARQCWPGGPP